ncbi:MAG: hypothetical protein ACYDD1_16680 [Caulobacteraceae bacterium]
MSRVSGACLSMLALAGLASAAHAQVADRYGPAAASSYDAPAAAALAGAPVRMLSWPGKTTLATAMTTSEAPAAPTLRPAFTVPRSTSPQPRPLQVASAAIAPSQPSYAARYVPPADEAPAPSPHYGLVQAVPAAPAQAARATAPAPRAAPSIYDDALARPDTARAQTAAASSTPAAPIAADPDHPGWAPPRRPWSQTGDTGVRFYSLHRQYGVKPDPAPIPPQFFAATADLGDPAGPMTRTISGAGSTAQAARAIQAAQSETSSDSSSSQP